jgi:superfamily I DNA/RNA helicase
MQSLVISHCASRKKYGQLMPCHPSRFLKELPLELVEDDHDKQPVNQESVKKMFDVIRSVVG